MVDSTEKPGNEQVLEGILARYLSELESGRTPDEAALLAEHPDLVDGFQRFLMNNAWFDKVTMVPVDPDTPCNPTGKLPRQFGDYDLIEEIGRGGMGVVYRAREHKLDRIVALKVIGAGRFASPEEVARLHREAKAAANLEHDNIVRIYAVGEHDGQSFLSMACIEGKSLAQLIADGPLPAAQAAKYIRTVAQAIQYAHEKGICHRDIKPANILIRHGNPMITDFGLAKRVGIDPQLTTIDAVVGTPCYMSPEQASHAEGASRPPTDVYSLGATLFALVTGRPPFRGQDIGDTLLQVQHSEPPQPRKLNPQIPVPLEAIILKCLEKRPERRYPTAAALGEDLGRFLEGEPVRAKRRGLVRTGLHFLHGIPLIAVLTGKKILRPTPLQTRAQWVGLGMAALLLTFAVSALWGWLFPIRIAGGRQSSEFSHQAVAEMLADWLTRGLKRRVVPQPTEGSADNMRLLERGKAEFGLVQYSEMKKSQGNNVRIVTLLYERAVYVIVRVPSNGTRTPRELGDLRGTKLKLCLQPKPTASRDVADQILSTFKLTDDIEPVDEPPNGFWTWLTNGTIDGAIVVGRRRGPQAVYLDPILNGEMADKFTVLSIPSESVKHLDPGFRQYDLPFGGSTVAVPVFLLAGPGAPDKLVTGALNVLYGDHERLVYGNLTAQDQAWKRMMNWPEQDWIKARLHPAAVAYFTVSPSRPATSPAVSLTPWNVISNFADVAKGRVLGRQGRPRANCFPSALPAPAEAVR